MNDEKLFDCIALTIDTFRKQSLNGEVADFGKPCTECRYYPNQCKADWYNIMKPIIDKSNVKIKLAE